MKKKISKKDLMKGVLCIVLLVTLGFLLKKYQECVIYDSLDVNVSSKVFEYGNSINLKTFFKDTNKDYKYSIVKDLNTSEVGDQKVVVQVEYKGVSKEVPIKLSVIDSTPPELEIKEESITTDEGNDVILIENVSKVSDHGEALPYKEETEVTEGDVNYYTIYANGFDYQVPGDYTINVVAVDGAGNKTQKDFTVKVNEVYKPPVQQYYSPVVANAAANEKGGDIVSIAYSYLGYPYVYGGATPAGFDCSGFVQYVYAQAGKYVSRSSPTQIYDGVGINYSDAQPGDIILWGHGGMITHSSLYIGNGQIIHAMNSNTGVVISNVDSWTNYDVMMSVRRIA